MRVRYKRRVVRLLEELRWTFSTASFMASAISAEVASTKKSSPPTAMEIAMLMRLLKAKGFLNIKPSGIGHNPETLTYQLKDEVHRKDVMRALNLGELGDNGRLF